MELGENADTNNRVLRNILSKITKAKMTRIGKMLCLYANQKTILAQVVCTTSGRKGPPQHEVRHVVYCR